MILTNVCLALIAFMLSLVVVWLFVLSKILKDFSDKYHLGVSSAGCWDFVSPDDMNEWLSNISCWFWENRRDK